MLAVREFIRVSEVAGWPLLLSAIAALVWANGWSDQYERFWHTTIQLHGDLFIVERSAKDWVNDALLPLLFFVAGMEIKRELLRGELAQWQRAALPFVTAVGGMVVPAVIYVAINIGGEHIGAWGIPVATDLAFVLMVFSLLGDRMRPQLKVLVLAYALVDDVGGVLVIAFFYSSEIEWLALAFASVPLACMIALLRLNLRSVLIYVPLGVLFWLAMLESGVHTTIAGVILGAVVPARPSIDSSQFRERARTLIDRYTQLERSRESGGQHDAQPASEGSSDEGREKEQANTGAQGNGDDAAESEDRDLLEKQDATLGALEELVRGTESTVDRLTRVVNPWVS